MKASSPWLAPVLLVVACATSGTRGGGDGVSGSSGGSGSGGVSSGGDSGAPAPGGLVNLTAACPAPNLGSPLLRLLTQREFDQTLTDIFPQVSGKWTDSLPSNNVSAYGFDNDHSNSVGNQLASSLLDTALSVATAVTGTDLATILPCSATSADRTCAETFLMQYGKRLFRHPLVQADLDRYMAFYDSSVAKSDFKTALKWMTVGLIQSPYAVYRSETGTDSGKGTRVLSPYEIATELAYTYTGSTPSADLLTKADSGNLGDTVALAATLLASDPQHKTVHRFFQGYLGYSGVTSIQKPTVQNFSTVSADMALETEAFIDDIVVAKKGGMKELLTEPTTYPSKALATFYQYPAPAADYAPITRPVGEGIGILAQGSFLATHANSNASSPTQRGLFAFARLLCHAKPTPPPNVPPIPTPVPGQITTRQRYEVQHAQGACASCHKLFDPIGFGFEHFNEAGQYRATESGLPINTASDVPNLDGTVAFSFADEEGLVRGLAAMPVSYQCFQGYLATYGFGSGETCLGTSKLADFQSGALGIVDAFASLAAEPHFSQRNSQ